VNREKNPHTVAYCPQCDTDMVKCGTCGNNCCNGGYGNLPYPQPIEWMKDHFLKVLWKILPNTSSYYSTQRYLMRKCKDCPSAYEMQDKLWDEQNK